MGAEGSSNAGSLRRAAEGLCWRVLVRPGPYPLPSPTVPAQALLSRSPTPHTLSPFRLTPEGGHGAPWPAAPSPSALSTTYLFMMCLPTSVDPVNPIFLTSGWSDSLWPTSEPAQGG